MKNSKQMAERVLQIRDKYVVRRSIKMIILKTAGIVFAFCLVAGVVLFSIIMKRDKSAGSGKNTDMVKVDINADPDNLDYDYSEYIFKGGENIEGRLMEDEDGKYVEYYIDTDGNEYQYERVGSHYGYFSSTGFIVPEDGKICLSCKGMKSAPATLYIYDEYNMVSHVVDLMYSSSVNYFFSMHGRYHIKVVSNVREKYSLGKIEIRGISDVFEQSLEFTKKDW